jgi:hypothetical protein
VILLQELQECPGVAILEELPDALRFNVLAYTVSDGRSASIPLEITCPLVKGRPLLARAQITVPSGQPCPPRWAIAHLEETLTGLVASSRQYRETSTSQDQERAQQGRILSQRAALQEAVSGFMQSGNFPDQNIARQECLKVCTELVFELTPNVTATANTTIGDHPPGPERPTG